MILYRVTQCDFVDGFQHFGDIRCIFYAEVERSSLPETLIQSAKITTSFPRKKGYFYFWQCILKNDEISQRLTAVQTEKFLKPSKFPDIFDGEFKMNL